MSKRRWSAGDVVALIRFPSKDALLKALQAGVLPAVTANRAVSAAVDDMELTFVMNDGLTADLRAGLSAFGVETTDHQELASGKLLICWAQALPLVPSGQRGRTVMQLEQAHRLPRWLAVLRRWQCRDVAWCMDPDSRAWINVVNLPSALLERAASEDGMKVYVEQSPNVWVQFGWRHPLPTPFLPSRDHSLLLCPERDWQVLATWSWKPAERHVFVAGDVAAHWLPPQLPRITVSPQLKPARETGAAELWIVANEESLQRWLSTADDRLVERLEAARVETESGPAVVLWARGGRGAPPVLLLEAHAYQPYLKLPNLFTPLGTQVSPPLRRDLAKRWLTFDPNHLTWYVLAGRLYSVPVSAFLPLSQCVTYIRPTVQPLQAEKPIPVFPLGQFEVKDRSAGDRIVMTSSETGDGVPVAMQWDGEQWRFLPRTNP